MISYLKKYHNHILFFSILFIIGFFLGISFAIKNKIFLEEQINYYISNIDNIKCEYLLFHFFILNVSFILSIVGLSPIFSSTITFYEGMSSGFTITLFTMTLGFNGLFYGISFFIITKLLYLLLSLIVYIKCLSISLDRIKSYLLKNTPNISYKLRLKGMLICFIIIMIYDILLSIYARDWLSLFKFLIMWYNTKRGELYA